MTVSLPKAADVVIVGGGVMGASTAYHLAQAGVKDVVLVERTEHFEDSATSRCAGGVRYQFGTEVNIRLSLASLPMLERFKDEIGIDPLYRQCGYLFVLTDPATVKRFEAIIQLQHDLGVDTDWLTGDDIRNRLPIMRFDDALAGTLHAKDGLADPNSVLMGYIQRARQLGVVIATGVEVVGFRVSDSQVDAVVTNAGDISTHQVVDAAGPWAAQVAELAGVVVPIEPVRRQMVTTTPLSDLPPDFPFVIDFERSLYFHQEGKGVLTGMSNPDQSPGFDQTIDEDWELTAMQAAMERLPMLSRAGRLTGWAGLYEVTPDAHPIFGRTPVDGFWLVAGFSGHGFMHGPIAGKLMAEFLTADEATTVDVSSLDLARFAEGRTIEEPNVV
jgi:sarcosine oxidase subunit beta